MNGIKTDAISHCKIESYAMRYVSTRGGGEPASFSQAVMTGLARDGGLLLPESFPDISAELSSWVGLSYQELAFEIMRFYITDMPEEDLEDIINRSYSVFTHPDVTPVKDIGPINILELFHGPTLAFKDIALQFLGNLFEYFLSKSGEKLNIVAATSGDTGSAAIYGVRNRKGVRIFVLYPYGRVSPVQEMQMTSVTDDNVHNIALQGTFDDAQLIVKKLFGDLEYKDKFNLGAVNSINWARVLAQIVYYFYSALQVMEKSKSESVSFSVPTGNFGDIFAGYVAAQMGLPIKHLYLATNENDILSRFFNTGTYSIGEVVSTLSPSMDIQAASNFERWLYLRAGRDAAKLSAWMKTFSEKGHLEITPLETGEIDSLIKAGSANTDETLKTIRDFYNSSGYVLDPHSAVGVHVALNAGNDDSPVICLATAHPAKFPDAVDRATGKQGLATTPQIEALKDLPCRREILPNDTDTIADYIAKTIRNG